MDLHMTEGYDTFLAPFTAKSAPNVTKMFSRPVIYHRKV